MKIEIVENTSDTFDIIIGQSKYSVPKHWFWPEFANNWEPQTFSFFEKNLIKGSNYLDLGGWIGPTALIATELGANKVIIAEPNPINFINLLKIQFGNQGFLDKWTILNVCVSNLRGLVQIGPLDGIFNSSSATNIRGQQGVEILSVLLEDVIVPLENLSLIKIDIEGAEELIVTDLSYVAKTGAAIWLSIHAPFYQDKNKFYENFYSLNKYYHITDHLNKEMDWSVLQDRILSEEKNPNWGTKFGNFFEVGMIPKI